MEEEEDEGSSGAPAWMATFADLMSLLLCFFVLLLSFSVMDAEKYKQIAGSMKLAFGVQRQVQMEDVPKGTSIIAQEFSPGETTPTPLEQLQQQTVDEMKTELAVGQTAELDEETTKEMLEEKLKSLLAETQADAEKLRDILSDEVQRGTVDVEADGRTITIRIKEQGSFPSGSAQLNDGFLPILDRLSEALLDVDGSIAIEGHTDNIPIRGGKMRSNWELSASRALSVAHEIFGRPNLDSSRFQVTGFADSKPRASNDTWEGRAANRRVEIVIRQPALQTQESVITLEGEEVDRITSDSDALQILDAKSG